MCGIAGLLHLDGCPSAVEEPVLRRMRDVLTHRGPDGAGTWISADRRVGLAHRRLAVIDPTPAAAQPLCNEDGSLWLTYNGEIYNHAALRQELTRLGPHRWRTDHADSEVILHAYEEWGLGCLDRLQGMFAFALWDAAARRLWLVRDRIGIKPLYYCHERGRFGFASEIKALLTLDRPKEAEENSLLHYLTFSCAPAPQTAFKGIEQLPAGSWLLVSPDGTIRRERYWDVWDHAAPKAGLTDRELAGLVLAGLRDAVGSHAVSDVPAGVFLSGGIDSSAVAALYAGTRDRPIATYTVGFTGDNASYRNETSHARHLAETIGATYREKLLEPGDLAAAFPSLVDVYDEPLGNPVCYPLYRLSRLAREDGAIVALSGEGADEAFFGYTWYLRALKRHARYAPVSAAPFLGKAACGLLRGLGCGSTPAVVHLERAARGRPVFWGSSELLTGEKIGGLLSRSMSRRLSAYDPWEVIRPIYERFTAAAWENGPDQWFGYLDLCLRLPNCILPRVDKMSMANGLECRVPFLDHQLIELAFSLPGAAKHRGDITKALLKQALRGIVPDALIDRNKQGLWTPVQEWYGSGLAAAVEREILDFNGKTGFLDARAVRRRLDKPKPVELWYLYAYALWWKRHFC